MSLRAVVVAPDPETRLLVRRALGRAGVQASFHAHAPDALTLARAELLVLGAGAPRGRALAQAVAARGGRVVSILRSTDADAMGAHAVVCGPLPFVRLLAAITHAVGAARARRHDDTGQRRRAALV